MFVNKRITYDERKKKRESSYKNRVCERVRKSIEKTMKMNVPHWEGTLPHHMTTS